MLTLAFPLSTGLMNSSTALAMAPPPPLVQIVNSNLSLWTEPKFNVLHVVGEVQNNDPLRNAQNIRLDCKLSYLG